MKKYEIWLDKIIESSLCLMIFAIPFSKSMVEIFFMSAITFWVLKRISSYKLHASLINLFKPINTKLNVPICFFAFIGLFSTLISISPSLSVKGFFLKLLKSLMLYFITVEIINNGKKLKNILVAIFVSIILTCADGIYQLITGMDLMRHYPLWAGRMQSSFGNPNSFASWLTIMIPLALGLSCFNFSNKYFWLKKYILWLLICVLIFCLVLTHSKGAWIAVFLSVVFLAILQKRGRGAIIIILGLLILMLVFLPHLSEYINDYMTHSESNRLTLWIESLAIIKDFPLLGCGLNTYSIVAPNYKIVEWGGIYPHNSYLQMAAETGLLGLGAFLWIIITIFKTSSANLKKINDKFYSALLSGLLAGLFAFLAHSFVDTDLYSLQLRYLMWFVIGLIVAVQKVALDEKSKSGEYNV